MKARRVSRFQILSVFLGLLQVLAPAPLAKAEVCPCVHGYVREIVAWDPECTFVILWSRCDGSYAGHVAYGNCPPLG
jgi:hypothetical protein